MAANVSCEKDTPHAAPVDVKSHSPAKDDITTEAAARKSDSDIDHLEVGKQSTTFAKWHEAGLTEEEAHFLANVSPEEEKKIIRKIDYRVVPMLAMLYLISHLDRANLGNAKIEGLEKTLGMTGNDYNIAVSIFFIPYILLEVPSNMVLAKFTRPSLYIGILVTCWGLVVTFSGLAQNFAGLCVARFLVGVFEAGFFPGAVWLLSNWYPPYKTQSRTAIFYLSAAGSGAFSGLLAAAIAQMDGLGGLEGWRWIFIIEGIISVLCGITSFILLPDTPSLSGRWLNADEQRYVNLLHQATRGNNAARGAGRNTETKKRFNWNAIKAILTDKHIYLQAIIFSSSAIPNNGMKYTLPQIVRNMGYKSTQAQLLSVPPYVAGAIMTVASSFWVDKRGSKKMPVIIFLQCLLVLGFSVLFHFAPTIQDNIAVCYTFTVVGCMGIYAIIPACNTWCLNNLAGAEKRVSGVAFLVTLGNTGGFIGSWVFLNTESPAYPTGFGTCLSVAGAGILCAIACEYFYGKHNKKWENYSRDQIEQMYTAEELEKMGDRSPLFKYGL